MAIDIDESKKTMNVWVDRYYNLHNMATRSITEIKDCLLGKISDVYSPKDIEHFDKFADDLKKGLELHNDSSISFFILGYHLYIEFIVKLTEEKGAIYWYALDGDNQKIDPPLINHTFDKFEGQISIYGEEFPKDGTQSVKTYFFIIAVECIKKLNAKHDNDIEPLAQEHMSR